MDLTPFLYASIVLFPVVLLIHLAHIAVCAATALEEYRAVRSVRRFIDRADEALADGIMRLKTRQFVDEVVGPVRELPESEVTEAVKALSDAVETAHHERNPERETEPETEAETEAQGYTPS